MTEIIITSSILILIVLALRFLLRGKLSPAVIYALWAIVALRLLLPFNIADTRLSVMNLFERRETIDIEQTFQSVPDYMLDGYIPNADADWNPEELPYVEYEIIQNEQNGSIDNAPVDNSEAENDTPEAKDILLAVWLTGAAAVLGYALFSNIHFWLRLKNSRELLYENTFLPVYLAEGISTPCLFGLIRPGIYLNEFAAGDRQRAEYIINHEYTHYAHRDHIWAVVRVLCVSVYWFNPLVWIAASMSRQDSELACDSAVVRTIGEEHRLDYGRTLVDMIGVRYTPANVTLTVTSMNSGAKSIKDRISTICRNPKTLLWSAITVCVVIIAAFVVTFTGAAERDKKTPSWETVSYSDTITGNEQSYIFNIAPDDLPSNVSYDVYFSSDPEDKLPGIMKEAWTLKDRDIIMSALDLSRMNEVEPEEIPSDSWVNAYIRVNTYEHYTVTNDGYLMWCSSSGAGSSVESVAIDTDNIFAGDYLVGKYAFYRMLDGEHQKLVEQLIAIYNRHEPKQENIELVNNPKVTRVMLYDTEPSPSDIPYDIFAMEDPTDGMFLVRAMHTDEWQDVGLNGIPADSKLAAYIILDEQEHFLLTTNGYALWKYDAFDVENSGDLLFTNENAPFRFANDYFYEGYCGGYRMPDGAAETLLHRLNVLQRRHYTGDEGLADDQQAILDLIYSGSCCMEYLDSYVILDTQEKIDDVLSYLPIHSIAKLPRFDSSALPEDNRVYESCYFSQIDTTHITYGVSMHISVSQYAAWMTIPVDKDECIELELTNNTSLYALMHYFTREHIAGNRTFVTGNGHFDNLFCSDINLEYPVFAEPYAVAYGGEMFCGLWELFSDAGSWTAVEKPATEMLAQSDTVKLSSIAPYSPPDCMMTVYVDAGYVQLIFKSDEQWYYVPDGLAERCERIEDI